MLQTRFLFIIVCLNIENYHGNELVAKEVSDVLEASKDSNCGTKGSMDI